MWVMCQPPALRARTMVSELSSVTGFSPCAWIELSVATYAVSPDARARRRVTRTWAPRRNLASALA